MQCLKLNSLPDLDSFDASKEKTSGLDLTNNCLICLETVTQSVATMCGHLFCLKCIHKWIETKPVCPVCNSRISKDKLIRLYGITDKPEATSQLDSSAQSSFSDINNTTQQQLDESNQSQTADRSRGRANQVMNSVRCHQLAKEK